MATQLQFESLAGLPVLAGDSKWFSNPARPAPQGVGVDPRNSPAMEFLRGLAQYAPESSRLQQLVNPAPPRLEAPPVPPVAAAANIPATVLTGRRMNELTDPRSLASPANTSNSEGSAAARTSALGALPGFDAALPVAAAAMQTLPTLAEPALPALNQEALRAALGRGNAQDLGGGVYAMGGTGPAGTYPIAWDSAWATPAPGGQATAPVTAASAQSRPYLPALGEKQVIGEAFAPRSLGADVGALDREIAATKASMVGASPEDQKLLAWGLEDLQRQRMDPRLTGAVSAAQSPVPAEPVRSGRADTEPVSRGGRGFVDPTTAIAVGYQQQLAYQRAALQQIMDVAAQGDPSNYSYRLTHLLNSMGSNNFASLQSQAAGGQNQNLATMRGQDVQAGAQIYGYDTHAATALQNLLATPAVSGQRVAGDPAFPGIPGVPVNTMSQRELAPGGGFVFKPIGPEAARPQPVRPSKAQFMEKAQIANPKMTSSQLLEKYHQLYGQ